VKTFFNDACIESDGARYEFSAEEGRALESASNYWHAPSDPSSWLAVATFLAVRRRVGDAGDALALPLAAQSLGVKVTELIRLIQWHENYMRFHDNDPDYRVL
jgi:hypothetical protein